MLGKLVYEGRGKTVGMRVLPNGKIEQTVVMQGMFLGEESSATWTSENDTRPDGTMYVEAHGFFTTKDGTFGRYNVIGNGVMKPDGSGIARGVVCYLCPPGKYAYLNGIAVVWENEFDKEGNIQNKGWEWK
jgi:hypothetical protein